MRQGTSVIYFKSLNRHLTFLGVDRRLFFLFVGLTAAIAFSARFHPVMIIVSFLVFIILYISGILITRADNQMLEIYRRHIHFKKYYPAIGGIHAKSKIIKPSVPIYVGKRGLI